MEIGKTAQHNGLNSTDSGASVPGRPLSAVEGGGKKSHATEHSSRSGLVGESASTGTLGKAMDVLNIVANASRPPRFTEILQQSDQPRGTLHRQLTNLVAEGLLNQRADQAYELGYTLLRFAARAWAGNEFRSVAHPHLKSLHEMTGETVHLAVLRQNEVVYLDKVEGTQSVRMHSQIGNASPAYCTGVGKAALSVLNERQLEDYIRSVSFHRYTESTIADAADLRSRLAQVREAGFAFDDEEHETGIHCVSSPVYSADLSLIAAISVTGPVYRITRSQLETWAETVRTTAYQIMEDMQARLGPRA
ncbi:MAG: IclR family transcriptional regulator [Pseudomonadota bacterium]